MALFNLAARAGIPAARSALRFMSKLRKPPSGGITVYLGEFFKPPIPKKEMAKMYDESKRVRSLFPFSNPELRKQAMEDGILETLKPRWLMPAIDAFCPYYNIRKRFWRGVEAIRKDVLKN